MAATAKKTKKERSNHDQETLVICLQDREARIAELAYFKAENRGFAPGYELEDWFEAEQEFAL